MLYSSCGAAGVAQLFPPRLVELRDVTVLTIGQATFLTTRTPVETIPNYNEDELSNCF